MDGLFTGSRFTAELWSDMYLEQGLLITASFHIAKENRTAYAGNTLDDHISDGVQIIH